MIIRSGTRKIGITIRVVDVISLSENNCPNYFEMLFCSLYDEDGYGAVKRVLERGEDVETVKPMATIVVNYPVSTSLYIELDILIVA